MTEKYDPSDVELMSNAEEVAETLRTDMKIIRSDVLYSLIPITLLHTLIFLILLRLDFPVPLIATLTGFCETTVYRKKRLLREGNLLSLFPRKKAKSGRKSKITGADELIIEHLESHDYRSVSHVRKMIEVITGLPISETAARNWLHAHEYKYLKSGSFPAKANPQVQRSFYEKQEKGLLELALKGKAAVFHMDAAHFIHGGNFVGGIWCRNRRFVQTFSGRTRYNVLGAINFSTKEIHTVTNTTYITSTQVVEMLELLAATYTELPIYVFLDNARYQKCSLVTTRAKELGINLVFLPPYSPNLNLIERLWKYVKKELRCSYFDNFNDFRGEIDRILRDTQGEKKAILEKLMGMNVQLFDELDQKSKISSEQPSKNEKTMPKGKRRRREQAA